MFKTKMSRDLAKVIAFYIILVELVLMGFSYQAKKAELNELRITLEKDVQEKSGQDFHELHPGILDQKDIQRRLDQFLINIAFLTLIIVVVTWAGVLFFFHQQVGRHVIRLKRLNQMNRGTKVARWIKDDDIPDNEVGELIQERERLISKLEDVS